MQKLLQKLKARYHALYYGLFWIEFIRPFNMFKYKIHKFLNPYILNIRDIICLIRLVLEGKPALKAIIIIRRRIKIYNISQSKINKIRERELQQKIAKLANDMGIEYWQLKAFVEEGFDD